MKAASRAVRALLGLAYPEYAAQQATLRDLGRTLKQIQSRLHGFARQQPGLVPLADELDRLCGEVDDHTRVTPRMVRRGERRSEPTREERRVLQRLERIAARTCPIVVGPWSGEVGFELLYWIPFVHWFQQRFGVDRDRLIVLSRGGVSGWYAHITERYVETFGHLSIEAYRQATETAKKQRSLTATDARLLRRVVAAEHLGRVHVLHPEAMYRILWAFFKRTAARRHIDDYTSYTRLGGADSSDVPARLPDDFIAVRFYFSQSFPDTPDNRAFVSDIIDTLSAHTDIVVLNTPFAVDDHVDYQAAGPRVHTVPRMPAERNLAIQTAVIRRARAFVGTYGGYSYLAPFYGVPSLAFHSTQSFFTHHLEQAQRVFGNLGASLVTLDVRDVALVRSALQRTGATPGVTA